MFEGCLQAMAFYLTGLGFTLERDGWRFEPVPEETYQLRCRGQVLPSSKLLTYEIFVDEVVGGPLPTLYADVLCTVDGLKAFHCRRLGVRLVPDWPLEEQRAGCHRTENGCRARWFSVRSSFAALLVRSGVRAMPSDRHLPDLTDLFECRVYPLRPTTS